MEAAVQQGNAVPTGVKPGVVISIGAGADDKNREVLASIMDRNGYPEVGAAMRNQALEKGITTRAKSLWKYSPTVGDLAIVAAAAGGVWLVYQGVRYLLRDTVDLPKLGGWTFQRSDGKVLPIRRAA